MAGYSISAISSMHYYYYSTYVRFKLFFEIFKNMKKEQFGELEVCFAFQKELKTQLL